jgi:hypothetical protein
MEFSMSKPDVLLLQNAALFALIQDKLLQRISDLKDSIEKEQRRIFPKYQKIVLFKMDIGQIETDIQVMNVTDVELLYKIKRKYLLEFKFLLSQFLVETVITA